MSTHKLVFLTLFIIVVSFTAHFESLLADPVPIKNRESSEKEALQEVLNRFVVAWNRDDAEAMSMLFSPDGEFMSPAGSIARTRPEIRRLIVRERQEMFKGMTLKGTPTIFAL